MRAVENASTTSDVPTWHSISADGVAKRLATDVGKGLDQADAANRLQKYGPNRLPEGKKRGPFMRFLSQFNNVLVYVLLGAGFTKLMLNLWVDASIIFGVVILNALLGFIQEGRAEKALESIRNMLSAEARTLRGGETRIVPADQLVPGDIVLLESGDKIPADLRLEGEWRSDRRGALPLRDQARHGPAGRAGGVSADRLHTIRVGTQVHGNAPQIRRWQGVSLGQGRARSHPRTLR
jgi:cation transport ATPase-like protein/E1-E2 ATPase